MALASEILGDRWTLLVLREAFYGVQRYDDMLADLGAPRSTLTDRLAKLVERGIMTRRAYQEPGARTRHAYVLTEAGRSLALTLLALTQWGEEHVLHGVAPVEIVDRSNGRPLRVELVDGEGRITDLKDAMLSLRKG